MYYAYVSPTQHGVTKNYGFIENVIKLIPYHTFRVFKTEEEAWNFIARRKHSYILQSLYKYGDIFDGVYLTINYIIREEVAHININTSKFGYVRLAEEQPENILVEYRNNVIYVEMKIAQLNRDSINSHALVIFQILKLLGTYADIELLITNMSIFYLLTMYGGNRFLYKRLRDLISSRSGNLALTYKGMM